MGTTFIVEPVLWYQGVVNVAAAYLVLRGLNLLRMSLLGVPFNHALP